MLKVNEIFGPTIQGEGKSTGNEVIFLRLAMCNLHCFKCDTPYTWFYESSKGTHVDGVRWDKKKETHLMNADEVFDRLHNLAYHNRTVQERINRVVISGGEPFLQQKALLPVLDRLKRWKYIVEVETNGTIVPSLEFVELIDQINCSPKLDGSFSGESRRTRIRMSALEAISRTNKANFKFVIAEPENVKEVLELIDTLSLTEVYLMPEGRTKKELQGKEWLQVLAKEHNVNFTPRLHIELWDSKRAV